MVARAEWEKSGEELAAAERSIHGEDARLEQFAAQVLSAEADQEVHEIVASLDSAGLLTPREVRLAIVLAVAAGVLYFTAATATKGYELWRSASPYVVPGAPGSVNCST